MASYPSSSDSPPSQMLSDIPSAPLTIFSGLQANLLIEWLPLQDQHHVYSTSLDHLCPSCQQHLKMIAHILECDHRDFQAFITKLHGLQYKHHIKHQVGGDHYNLFAYGLYIGLQHPPPIPMSNLPPEFQDILQQQKLGWTQLYYGQLSTQWTRWVTTTHPTINSQLFYDNHVNLAINSPSMVTTQQPPPPH